jgi:hypothetical protein
MYFGPVPLMRSPYQSAFIEAQEIGGLPLGQQWKHRGPRLLGGQHQS